MPVLHLQRTLRWPCAPRLTRQFRFGSAHLPWLLFGIRSCSMLEHGAAHRAAPPCSGPARIEVIQACSTRNNQQSAVLQNYVLVSCQFVHPSKGMLACAQLQQQSHPRPRPLLPDPRVGHPAAQGGQKLQKLAQLEARLLGIETFAIAGSLLRIWRPPRPPPRWLALVHAHQLKGHVQ